MRNALPWCICWAALQCGCAGPRVGDVHEPPLASATPVDTVDDGGSTPKLPADAGDPAPSAITTSSAGAAASAVPVASTSSAGAAASAAPVASSKRAPLTCACFWWVHLDENGQRCFPTFGACQREFRGFGREFKRPCSLQHDDECRSFVCRDVGNECYRL